MRLILIRHGLTDDNLKKRYCGIRDVGVNKFGQQKLEEIKNKIRCLNVDTVLSSDLKRSWQTAKVIFGNKTGKIIKNPNLREINFGKWEGFTYNQILKRYPCVYKRWLEDPFAADIPQGEKLPHFVLRIKNELKKIINLKKIAFSNNSNLRFSVVRKVPYPEGIDLPKPLDLSLKDGKVYPLGLKEGSYTFLHHKLDKTVALVTHAGVMRVILNTLLKIKKQDFWHFKINPSAVYIIEYKAHLKPKVYTLKNG
jgi:broad specificity phosphatase PhoE